MPEREHDSNADKQKAYRERRKLEERDAGKPWAGLEGEMREQAIRDHFGYAHSEKSTQAERAAVASRIMARKTGPPSSSMPGFSAKKNDLSPSPAQLKKLGGLWPGR